MLPSQRLFINFGISVFAFFAGTGAGLGQEADSPRYARDVFWSAASLVPPPRDGKTIAPKLALRYSILKRTIDHTYEEVSPNMTFHAGDSIRLKVTSNEDGYLYIVEQGSSGAWSPLYPLAGATGATKLTKFQDVVVPPGNKAWTFKGKPGEEKVFILLSSSPQVDMEQTIASLRTSGGTSPRIEDQVIAKLQGQLQGQVNKRELVLTNPDEIPPQPEAKPDHAAYVANAKGKARVLVNVVLPFK